MSDYDTQSFELANTRLRSRDGLNITLHESQSETTYVVRDGVSPSYHQIGLAQYTFLSALDGKSTLDQITGRIASELPEHALSSSQAEQTARYLLDCHLAVAVDASGNPLEATSRLKSQIDRTRERRKLENANPLFLKYRLGNPSRFVNWITPWTQWVFSPLCLAFALVVSVFAAGLLWQNNSQLAESLRGVISPASTIWLAITFVGLKIVHELGHAVACRRLGGVVRETGVVFILFVPIPYVDVTSSWAFTSKRERILVSAAGMMVEMMIASVAAIAWSMTTDPEWRFHLTNVMLMGTVTTLLFNANFLMRFDGYFLLSDAIEIPNLAAASRQCTHARLKQLLLGNRTHLPADLLRNEKILLSYGIAAMIWRVLVCIGLAIAASKLFYGFGIVLATASMLAWLGRPVLAIVRSLIADSADSVDARRTLVRRTVPAFAIFAAMLCLTPWPGRVSSPAVVRHHEAEIVRIPTTGFVAEVFVASGQHIFLDQPIARLKNKALQSEIESLRCQVDSAHIRARQEWAANAIASHQAEIAVADSLQARLDERLHRRELLTVRANASGQIMLPSGTASLDEWVGRFAREGMELARIIDPARKELLVSVDQADRVTFAECVNQRVQFVPDSAFPVTAANLQRVEPHAKDQTDPRLAASGGGPLSEQVIGTETRLIEPRFEAVVSLDAEASKRLASGLTGQVRLDRHPRSIAGHLFADLLMRLF